MKKTELFRFLKDNPKFFLIWLSQIFSQISINMINFVMATRIFERTGSTLAVSFLWIFFYLPALFIGPFSGYFVDIWDRRRVLLITNIVQATTILAYLFIGDQIYPIYPIVFFYSILSQFYFPAEAASIPALVKKDDLPLANSLFLFTSQTALALGFGLGGVFIRLFGSNFPIIFTSSALFIGAVAVYFLPKGSRKKFKLAEFSAFWSEVKSGYRYIRDTPTIFFPLIFIIFFQILLVILGVTVMPFAKMLNIQVADAGPLLIVPLALGALLGATLIGRLASMYRKKQIIAVGLVQIFIALLSFSQVIPRFASGRIYFALPLMLLLGFGLIFVFVPNQTLIQENTSPNFRGRVFGALGFASTSATLPILLFSATIVEVLGLPTLMFSLAFLVLVALLVITKFEELLLRKAILFIEQINQDDN